MGKRLPPVAGQPPLAKHIEAVKGSNAIDRARAAAPAYSQQLARRFARAIYDTKGRVKEDVVDENLQLLLQASRELGSPDASLGAGGEVGALTVSDLWAKMTDREKSTYLERMSTTAPGGEGEAVAREFLTNMAKGAEVYGPRSPNWTSPPQPERTHDPATRLFLEMRTIQNRETGFPSPMKSGSGPSSAQTGKPHSPCGQSLAPQLIAARLWKILLRVCRERCSNRSS